MFDLLQSKIINNLETAIYRCVKFDVDCAVGIFQTKSEHSHELVYNYIRATDSATQVDSQTSIVFFDYTDIDDAKYAFKNLHDNFLRVNLESNICYTQVYEEDSNSEVIINRLYSIYSDLMESDETIIDDKVFFDKDPLAKVSFTDVLV